MSKWTTKEIILLKEKYLANNYKTLSWEINHSPKAISHKIRRLSLWKGNLVKPRLYMSSNLAYVLGVLKGDGSTSIHKDGHYTVQLTVTNKIFAQTFYNALQKIRLNPHISGPNFIKPSKLKSGKIITPKKGRYRVRANSKTFVEWYKTLTLSKISIAFSKKKEFESAFVKGFYESEGCLRANKRGNRRICIANNNLDLLKLVQRILKRWKIDASIHPNSDGHNQLLEFYRTLYIDKFLRIVKPCIKGGKSG